MSIFQEPLSEIVWDTKYRYHGKNRSSEPSIYDTWQRVAKAIAKAEMPANRKIWQQAFFDILKDFCFLPGGRILAGAGTVHSVTLFNCFVMPVADSLESIFTSLKEGAITLQQGGGVGYDFSPLRPSGFPAEHAGTCASGPVSFMRIWDAMSATMQSTGARRGAMMGILRCDHPDIEDFITAKANASELRHFNVSVLITDAFMQAVKNNAQWALVFPQSSTTVVKHVNAKQLWEKILRAAYDYAEPGVIFADTINRLNTLWYSETITATNPCGEIPLPVYGACNLGSLNLTAFVDGAFTTQAKINWDKITKVTQIATRFLDNVISVSRYPLTKQKQQAHATRRIGLGITGLGDAFVMLGIKYGCRESFAIAKKIMQHICQATWQTSIELAKERGSFPGFNKALYLQGGFVQSLSSDLQKAIALNGIRNSHHNTIAPTGTISLLANNVSNGIEPIFSGRYERAVRTGEEIKKHMVMDYALRNWQQKQANATLPPAWIDAQQLLPEQHLQMQAAMQPYIDNAISKTINLPEKFSFEKLNDVYQQAYVLGLKGCTIFRPNAVTGSVLTAMTNEDCDICQQ